MFRELVYDAVCKYLSKKQTEVLDKDLCKKRHQVCKHPV